MAGLVLGGLHIRIAAPVYSNVVRRRQRRKSRVKLSTVNVFLLAGKGVGQTYLSPSSISMLLSSSGLAGEAMLGCIPRSQGA